MNHVVILVHEQDQFDPPHHAPYVLCHLVEIWRENGVRVSILRKSGQFVEANLAILHVDLTVVPDDYLSWARQYPVLLNGHVTDISKRVISSNLVDPGKEYRGPVIVKTNRNYGGIREATLANKGPLLRKYVSSVRRRLPWSCWPYLKTSDYRIFDSVSQVPRLVWHNPDLIVERFLPEYRDGHYCIRTWMFLGDKERVAIFYSKDPIIKSTNIIRYERLFDVPEELRQIRRKLGFDFGKFDYAVCNDKVVLYDANRTPSLGSLSKEQSLPLLQELSEGIRGYL